MTEPVKDYTPLSIDQQTHDGAGQSYTPPSIVVATPSANPNYNGTPYNPQDFSPSPPPTRVDTMTPNQQGLVGAGTGIAANKALTTGNMGYKILNNLAGGVKPAGPGAVQNYADTVLAELSGRNLHIPLEDMAKLSGFPEIRNYEQAAQAGRKIVGAPAQPDTVQHVYARDPQTGQTYHSHSTVTPGTPEIQGIDPAKLTPYEKNLAFHVKKIGAPLARSAIAGYDIGRGLSDPASVGGIADIGAGISAAAAPLIKNKWAKVGANIVGGLPVVGAMIPGASAAPLKPHEVAGTAVDLATGWMSPTELGKATTQPKNEMYYPGMHVLQGSTLPPGHAEGGDIKKSPASIAGTLQEVGTVQGPSLASKWSEHLASLPQTTAQNMARQTGALSLGKNGIEVSDPAAWNEFMNQMPNMMGSVSKSPVEHAMAELFDPIKKSGAQLAREAEYVHNVVPTHNFSEPNKISIQDLQGGVLVGVPGDRSLAGHSLLSVNGVPLSRAAELHGGPRYGQRKADLGKDAFWASQKGAASALQNKAANAAETAKGNPVFGMYTAMAPDASNYALHHTEALVNQLDALNPNKAKLRAFDNMIRDTYPDFLGMNHPEVINQFAANSDLRKHVADRLNKTKIAAQYDMPSGEATIHAITDPNLRNVKTGTTGYSVGELNPFKELTPETEHPTYDTQIPGSFKGQMIAQLPWEHYFPDAAKQIAANPSQAPYAWGTFKMGDFHQPVTQELVDKIAPIEEMVKSATKDFQ